MIILKILLIILLVVLGLVLLLLLLPLGAEFGYIDGQLTYKVNVWILNVMDSDGGGLLGLLKKHKSKKKHKPPKAKKARPKKEKTVKEKKKKKTPSADEFDISDDTADTDLTAEIIAEVNEPQDNDTAESGNITDYDPDTDEVVNFDKYGDNVIDDDNNTKDDNDTEDDTDSSADDDDEEDHGLGAKIDKLIKIWESAKKPFCHIFKGFRFSGLYIDFIIANEDAYKCALNYGKISAALYRGLALMSRIFTVKFKTVDIQPGFGLSKGRWDVSARLRFRLGTFVIAGLWFLAAYLFRIFIPEKLKKRKSKQQNKT